MELVSTVEKNGTKPNPFEIILLQTTRKESNWKIEETLETAVVTLEKERNKRVQSLMFMIMMMIKLGINKHVEWKAQYENCKVA